MNRILCLGVVAASCLVYGCRANKEAQMPLPTVNVVEAIQQDYPWFMEYPAQVAGSLDVQIRAQVGGILQARLYNEGEFVAAGTQLFQIDDTEYKVALEKAQGSLSQAQAEAKRTQRAYQRMKTLRAENAVSQQDYDNALSSYETAKANVQMAQAGVQDARINLGYTKVLAPISGIAGEEVQTVGSLVADQGDSGLLTTMVQIDPLYINFSMPGSQFEKLAQGYRDGTITMGDADNPDMLKSEQYRAASSQQAPIYIEVLLANGQLYPQRGKLVFFDSSENTQTSSIAIKAQIPNPARSRELIPGQFVRVRLVGAVFKDAVLVPSSAVLATANGLTAYVVKEDNSVEMRPIHASLQNDLYMVASGLKAGERVIDGGLAKIRPGEKVVPSLQKFQVSLPKEPVQTDLSAKTSVAGLEQAFQTAEIADQQTLPGISATSSAPVSGK
ncbi:MAG: efflux RND transporter periplasmic adaptor subunit [Elusimicrobiaceae bacterium]|nr:efflux RND transporter periplasmic adaptor subunit [Elusimicrobiaceae bacterium]